MDKLIIAFVASTFAAAAAAQTGIVSPNSVADHGTPAMHAAESAQNLVKSQATQGLSGITTRRLAVNDTTKIADQGTQATRANDAATNIAVSKDQAKPVLSAKAGQDAVQQASKGATR